MLEVAIRGRWGDFALDAQFASDARVTALFGRSGAGKTSLVEALAGLRRPASGHITVDGEVLFDAAAGIDLAPEHRRLGYVFQDARLFPHLSVAGNLRYGAKRAKAPGDFGEIVELLDSPRCSPAARASFPAASASASPSAAPCSPGPAAADGRAARQPRPGPQIRDPALHRAAGKRQRGPHRLRPPTRWRRCCASPTGWSCSPTARSRPRAAWRNCSPAST